MRAEIVVPAVVNLDRSVDDDDPGALAHLMVAELLAGLDADQDCAPSSLRMEHDR